MCVGWHAIIRRLRCKQNGTLESRCGHDHSEPVTCGSKFPSGAQLFHGIACSTAERLLYSTPFGRPVVPDV
jgi:hypothetical protein